MLPPDRSHLATELRHPEAAELHRLDPGGLLALLDQANRTAVEAVEGMRPALEAFLIAVEPGFLRGGRLVYLGAGTSGRLGVLDASECPPTFQVDPGRVVGIIAGGDTALRRSSEGREDDPTGALSELEALRLGSDDTLLGIAAGGTTPYVLGALAWAAGRCRTALLTCVPLPCPSGVDHLLVADTGPELVTGSTRLKAGTATKLVLNAISTILMVRSGKVYRGLMVDLRASNAKLRDRAARIVATLTGLDRPAAFALLDQAGGAVKVAVVMQRLALDRASAEERLARAGGRLNAVIG